MLWNFADPAASEAAFRNALTTVSSSDDRLTLETQIARTYSLRSRFDEAHAVLDRIQPRLEHAGAEPHVRFLLERGRTFRSAKAPERARPLFSEAAARAHSAGLDALEVDALHMVALVEPAPEQQLIWNRKALAVAAASSDPVARNWDASLANNIGMSLHDQGRLEDALASFQSSLDARERIGDRARIREARWMVAWALRALHRHDEALLILARLKEEYVAAGAPDGYVFEEIGENLLAQGLADAARPSFAKAFALLSADTSLDRPDEARLARLQRLGQ
ncbi:MAG: tetratricopeptide repeat protein [Pseudomonadota bacterium]|nr:tetratricopeptide repeat protein [Pseudomonadota bacterium]